MSRFRFLPLTCLFLLLLGLLASHARAERPDPKLRPEAFWQARPQSDPITAALYQFDDAADAAVVIDDLEEAIGGKKKPAGKGAPSGPPTGVPDLTGMAAMGGNYGTPKMALRGDAKNSSDGRWGGGVKLAGAGIVEVTGLDTARVWEGEGALTLDLWVKPDADAANARTVILSLSGISTPDALRVERTGDGAATLWIRDQSILTHPRPIPAGIWTHVCLSLGAERTMTATLLIDGLPAGAGAEVLAPLVPGTIAVLGGPIRVGGGASAVGGGEPASRGLRGAVDVLRVTRGRRYFFELADQRWHDVAAARPIADGPPYFVRNRPPTLHWSFDDTLKPAQSQGVAAPGQPKPEDFQPGVRGKAFSLARANTTKPIAAGRNVFPLDRGTLEFWLQPLDWNNFFIGDYLGTNIPGMTLLHLGPVAGPPQHARALHIALGRAGAVADAPFVQIHPGAWTHVLCTWGPAGPAVYLNGLPQPMGQVGLGGDANATKQYKEWLEKSKENDDGAWGLVLDQSGTLLDELRIYDRQFNPMEAANAYARFFPDAAEKLAKLPLIGATYQYFAYRPETHISLACLPVGGVDPVKAKVTVQAPGASKPVIVNENVSLNADGVATIKEPGALEFLPYDVKVESFGPDGKSLHQFAGKYVREKPPWWQNTLGKDRVVPKPWTPILAKSDEKATTLEVWGRKITLDASGLPAQVSAAGAEVLAAAPKLHGTVNGSEVSFTGKGAKLGEAAPDLAGWRGSLAAAGIEADVNASIEFDGLMRFTVTLKSAGAPAKVDRLMLDFPVREASGQQLIVNGGQNNFRASYDVRMVPAGTGRVWDSKNSKPGMPKGVAVGHFVPMVWLGDDERGLCFFGENDKGWTPNPAEPAQELIRAEGSVTYRMNVITLPVTLDQPREFVFYVLPTPSKPLRDDWRAYNRAPQKQPLSTYDGIDDFCGFPMTEKYVGTPTSLTFALEPYSWEDAAKWRKFGKDKFGAQNPVWKYICASWPRLGPTMDDYRPELFWTGRLAWTREVEDYYAWTMCQWLERDIADGIYIDDVSFASTLLEQCGAYKLPDGKMQPGFGTLGLRRFFKRLWIYMDQHGKRPHILPHMTWCFELPAFSFIESGLNGEDRVIPPNHEPTFIDHWSRDEMRVMGGGKKFGFTTLWIPEIKTDNPMSHKLDAWVWRQSRAMHALALQHDFWYLFTYPSGRFISPPMTDFGIYEKDVRFVPYFNLGGAGLVKAVTATPVAPASEGGPAAPTKPAQPGQVLVSFWTRPSQGKALMLVSNLAKFNQTATVEIDAEKLLGKAGEVLFRDVDVSIESPVSQTASKSEMAAAEKTMLKDVPEMGAKGGGGLDNFSLEDERDKKKAAYAIQTQGPAATMQIRGNDFRILEVRLK